MGVGVDRVEGVVRGTSVEGPGADGAEAEGSVGKAGVRTAGAWSDGPDAGDGGADAEADGVCPAVVGEACSSGSSGVSDHVGMRKAVAR
ncbi:hypothetical protein HKX69_06580 [Streptomyces argyrophyllae]|uniref:Uncharacterized protein n=1 Tax=Streptomyces argyrophylli TaxID=2726118 RepID=A0A6M4PUA6_9ACTN|nr:hypothetical protein HKX69_06580 [Streptomyces argyrophyllae]